MILAWLPTRRKIPLRIAWEKQRNGDAQRIHVEPSSIPVPQRKGTLPATLPEGQMWNHIAPIHPTDNLGSPRTQGRERDDAICGGSVSRKLSQCLVREWMAWLLACWETQESYWRTFCAQCIFSSENTRFPGSWHPCSHCLLSLPLPTHPIYLLSTFCSLEFILWRLNILC